MKDLSEGLEEGEEDGDGWSSREDEEDANRGLLLHYPQVFLISLS